LISIVLRWPFFIALWKHYVNYTPPSLLVKLKIQTRTILIETIGQNPASPKQSWRLNRRYNHSSNNQEHSGDLLRVKQFIRVSAISQNRLTCRFSKACLVVWN